MNVVVVCSQCGKSFERRKGNVNQAIRNGHKIYCSGECRDIGMVKKIRVSCSNCGKETLVRRTIHEERESKKFFCCHSCSASYNNLGVRRHGNPVEVVCRNCGKMTRNSLWCSPKCKVEGGWKEKKRKIRESGVIQFGVEEHNRRIAKRFLIEIKGHQCEVCKLTEWMGQPIPLVLDHVDGNAMNYSVDNVRLVCGNCNMQSETFAGKNRGNGKRGKIPHI